jgi:hypothetical protein
MDIFEALSAKIQEKAAQLRDAVALGNVESFEDYKRICGEIRGLLIANDYIMAFKQEMEQSDE